MRNHNKHDQSVVSVTTEDIESDPMLDHDSDLSDVPLGEQRPLLLRGVSAISVMGTVRLTDGELVYVPPATADPRGMNLGLAECTS